jgi:hypothetical protein
LPRLGSRVRIPSPAPRKSPKNRRQCADSVTNVPASNGLNEPRTVPNCLPCSGKRRANRSRKVLDGPPPQKRSPALAANKRRAHREFEKSKRENNTKAGQDSQATECRLFWVTHGQTNIGFVEQVGDRYTAKDADERDIGLFDSLTAAANAVSVRYDKGSCPEPWFAAGGRA